MKEQAAPLALKIEKLAKTFHEGDTSVSVLRGIDLAMPRGSFLAVMGPSGSGKSTLLHLIAGLLTSDHGAIEIGGESITNMDDATITRFRRRRIGLVFQDFNLIPTLSAEENIALPLLLDRQTPDAKLLEELLVRFNLVARRHHLPHKLSGGERQRVAIARALVTQPEIILADEPTGNLDSPAGRAFCDLLRTMNKEHGCTILLVSHDPLVAATADRVALLNDGRLTDEFETRHDAALISEHYLKMAQKV